MVAPSTVVVGAGPAGLAAAMLLHKNGSQVTLVERASDPSHADPNRAFSYLVTPRGQRTLAELDLLDQLQAEAALGALTTYNLFAASGQVSRIPFPNSVTNGPQYWLARSALVGLMLQKAESLGVTVIKSAAVSSVRFDETQAYVDLVSPDGSRSETLHAELVLGCDGLRSAVRASLDAAHRVGVVMSKRGFGVKTRHSAAVGLPYKIIQLGAQPLLPHFDGDSDQELQAARPNETYVCKGILPGREAFHMGMLPVGAGADVTRTGTFIMPANRKFWNVRDAESMYKHFERNFPYINVRNLIAHDEMQRFASTPMARFPPIQRSKSLVGTAGEQCGGALLGDAAHGFPPDLGQGVNSALEDALLLSNALADAQSVGEALRVYEKSRDADVDALLRLMQIGQPYQYRQSQLGYLFFTVNIQLRAKLNRLAPGLFWPQTFVAIGDNNASYSEILRRVNVTTLHIYAVSLLLIACVIALLMVLRLFIS